MDDIENMGSKIQNLDNLKGNIHPQALIDKGAIVGERTRVWAFAHILSGARIGDDCNICDHTFVEGNVVVGNRVTVKCGVYLWDGVRAEDDVFIGPAAVFTNDLRPRSGQYPEDYLSTTLRTGCSIGANATILAGITIGEWALVGAGSVVTKNVANFAAVWGNPARFHYWICQCSRKIDFSPEDKYVCVCGNQFTFDSERKIAVLCQ